MSQEKVLKALYRRYRIPGSRLPSLDELATDMGLSHSATYAALQRLKVKGLVTWDRLKSRTIRPTRTGILAAQGYRLSDWRGNYNGKDTQGPSRSQA